MSGVKRYEYQSERIGYENADGIIESRMGGLYESDDGRYVLASDYDDLERAALVRLGTIKALQANVAGVVAEMREYWDADVDPGPWLKKWIDRLEDKS